MMLRSTVDRRPSTLDDDGPTAAPVDPEKLRADIEAGRTITSIATEYGCSDKTVRNAMHRYGIVRPRRFAAAHPELEEPVWLRREYVEKGRTTADIAGECNADASTIAVYLARAEISTRGHLTERMPAELRDRVWLTAANAERSHNAIALELGVSPKTVTLTMRKLGIIE